jgi:hypothetical protein
MAAAVAVVLGRALAAKAALVPPERALCYDREDAGSARFGWLGFRTSSLLVRFFGMSQA